MFQRSDVRISLASRASDRNERLESDAHVLLVIVISTLLEMILEYFNVQRW